MANTKNLKRILDFLKTKETAVSPTELVLILGIRYKSIIECLSFLLETNQIIALSSAKGTTLVQIKKGGIN